MWIALNLAVFLVSAAVGTWTTHLEQNPRFVQVSRSAYNQICETYPARTPDSSSCTTMLHVCPEGLIYSPSDSTSQDPRLVPWDRIMHWELDKPQAAAAPADATAQPSLEITESRGLFLPRSEHRLALCTQPSDEHEFRARVKSYSPPR